MMINAAEEELTPLVEIEIKGESPRGTSWFMSAFLVVNAALGAGLLNFPIAYHQAGGVATAVGIQMVNELFYQSFLVTDCGKCN